MGRGGDDHGDARGRLRTGDPAQLGLAGADLGDLRGDPGVRHQPGHLAALVGQDERDDAAGLPGARRTAAAVQVVLVVARRVDVDDEVQVVDVDAPGGDVRGDEDRDVAGLEPLQGPGALRLGLAAVQGGRPDPALQQVVGELVDGVLGVQEHDHAPVPGGDLRGGGVLVGALDVEHVVLHRRDGTGGRVDGVDDRVVEVAPHQQVDVAVEGGREEHPLPLRVHLVEQLGDLRHEPHVGHLVGLVEDGDGDPVQPAVAALDEVLEPARGGDDDLGAAAQRARLTADGHAAHDGGEPQLQRPGVRGEGVGHLLGQLTRRYEHQGQRALGIGAAPLGAGQQRQAEREGLARAGPAAAEDVPAGQRVRQGGRLDRERHGHPLRDERRLELGGHLQLTEGLGGGQRRGDGHRQGELALQRGAAAPGPTAGAPATAAGATGSAADPGGAALAAGGVPRCAATAAGGGGARTGAGESVVRAGGAFAVHAEPFLDGARIEGFFFRGINRERHPESQERADEMTKGRGDVLRRPRKQQRAGARTPRCGPQLRRTT